MKKNKFNYNIILPIILPFVILKIYIYIIISCSNSGNNLVADWLEITKPISYLIASNFPIFEKYNNIFLASGNQYLMPRFWNIYIATWLVMLITAPYYLYKSFNLADFIFKKFFKGHKKNFIISIFLYAGLILTMIFSGILSSWSLTGKDIILEKNLINNGMIENCISLIIVSGFLSYYLFLSMFILVSLKHKSNK